MSKRIWGLVDRSRQGAGKATRSHSATASGASVVVAPVKGEPQSDEPDVVQWNVRKARRKHDLTTARNVDAGEQLQEQSRALVGRVLAVRSELEYRQFNGRRANPNQPYTAWRVARSDELIAAPQSVERQSNFPSEHDLNPAEHGCPPSLPGDETAITGGHADVFVGVRCCEIERRQQQQVERHDVERHAHTSGQAQACGKGGVQVAREG